MGYLDKDIEYVPRKVRLTRAQKRLLRGGKKKKQPRREIKIPRMSYKLYMGSAYWIRRKNKYFSKHGKACAVCGKKYGTTLHHAKYDNNLYGREPDEHLYPLCGKHHHEYHEIHGTQQDMIKSTQRYIEHARQMYSFEEESSWISNL